MSHLLRRFPDPDDIFSQIDQKMLAKPKEFAYSLTSSDVVTNILCFTAKWQSIRVLSSVGRAAPLQGVGREFEPLSTHQSVKHEKIIAKLMWLGATTKTVRKYG